MLNIDDMVRNLIQDSKRTINIVGIFYGDCKQLLCLLMFSFHRIKWNI